MAIVYNPSKKELEYARFCIKKNLVRLSICKSAGDSESYHLTLLNEKDVIEYFLINFSMPATPANRKTFTEKEAMSRMFEVYKEFYMRNNNIEEKVIATELSKDKENKEIKVKKKVKKPKPENQKFNQETDKFLNTPFKQSNLLDLIEECEKENANMW
jgi:hypothetical protein